MNNLALATLMLPLDPLPHWVKMITTARHHVVTVQGCSDYPNHPAVQLTAVATLNAANDLDATLTKLTQALALVASLKTTRGQQAVALHRSHGTLESALNTASGGDVAAITAWGGQVETRTSPLPTTVGPEDAFAKTIKSKPGAIMAKCKADKDAICYLFQQGTDPAHPEAWPPPVISSGSTFKLENQTPGTKLYFRIAIQRRKTGQGAWSGVIEVLVR